MDFISPRGENIAICGLDCYKCSAYKAHKKNDDKLRAKTAKEWNKKYADLGVNIKPEEVDCAGCKNETGPHGFFVQYCPVRACAFDREIDTCCICREFRNCESRKRFEKVRKVNIGEEIGKTFPTCR